MTSVKIDWDIEKALAAAGSWGRYQKFILVLAFASGFPNAFVSMHFVFSHYERHHHCTFPKEYLNYTNKSAVNDSRIASAVIPFELNQRNELVQSQCKMYHRNYSQYPVDTWKEAFVNYPNSTVGDCTNGLSYAFPEAEETAVMKYSMICDDDWKAPLAVSLFAVGLGAGCFIGVAADWYGRRPMFIAACIIQILSEILTALSWNYPIYCIALVLTGASSIACYIIVFVLVTEVTDSKWRNVLSVSSSFGYSLGYCSVAIFAYMFQHWRVFIGSMTAFSAILFFPCCCFLPESPRWLVEKGRSDDAIKYLKVIARVNGKKETFARKVKGKFIVVKNDVKSSGISETITVLFKSGLALRFSAIVFGWLMSAVVYVSFSLFSTDFSEDRFINVFLSGLIEVPAVVTAFILVKYLGRPRSALLLMSICGISTTVLPFITGDLQLLSTTFAILGKGSISAVYFVWYLLSTEALPTLQRSSALSVCSTISRIGSFCSPYLMYFRKYNYWMPNVSMGIACLLCGLCTIFHIPETLGVNLPDTAQEAKENKRFYRFNIMRKFAQTGAATSESDDQEAEQEEMIQRF